MKLFYQDNPKLRLTPKKQKNDSLLVMPIIQSPAGPMAVRSPSFAIAGFTVFSLRELSRTQFTLNKVLFNYLQNKITNYEFYFNHRKQ